MTKRFRLLILLLAASPLSVAAPAYVGGNICKTCHPGIWNTFFKNPHYRSAALGDLPQEETGCEGCHGPGGDHVKKPSKTTIRAFSAITPTQTLDACLACHGKTMQRANIRRSSHTQADVVCTNCHAIHSAATPKFLLASAQTDLCYRCHVNVKAQFSLPFKHRVNEGVIACSDCHNPHGGFAPTWRMAQRPRMMEQAFGNEEPCLRCHNDKRGPFVFEHTAVRVDGCESCHVPHGSTNARLLKRPVVFTVCLECHNGAGNFGRQGNGVNLTPSSHNLANPRFQNCTACHVRIHGSNADQFFLR